MQPHPGKDFLNGVSGLFGRHTDRRAATAAELLARNHTHSPDLSGLMFSIAVSRILEGQDPSLHTRLRTPN